MERIIDITDAVEVDIAEKLGVKHPMARVVTTMVTSVLGGIGAAYIAEIVYLASVALTGYAFIGFLIALMAFVLALTSSVNVSMAIGHFVGAGKPMKIVSSAVNHIRSWRKS